MAARAYVMCRLHPEPRQLGVETVATRELTRGRITVTYSTFRLTA
jgi:hypothetical protein